MPAISFTTATGCQGSSGFIKLLSVGSTITGGAWFFHCTSQDTGTAYGRAFDPATDLPLSVDALPNEDFDCYVSVVAGGNTTVSAHRIETLACGPPALAITALAHADVTQAGSDGSISVTASGGTAPLTARVVGQGAAQPLTAGQPLSFSGLPAGTYTVEVADAAGVSVSGQQTIAPYTAPVLGCTDPEAANYNPAATQSDFSCVYAPRLALAEPTPQLVANGRPVLVTLASAAIAGAVSAPAQAFISVEYLRSYGVQLEVNGYLFESGPVLLPHNFTDAVTLAEALQAIPALNAAYRIRQSQDDEVHLLALTSGTPDNLTITTSEPGEISIVTLPGVNQWQAQRRERWGMFLEVWCGAPASNPSTFSEVYEDAYRDRYGRLSDPPAGGAAVPVLAQRLEMSYRADNAYTFDIAPALRQFTGHAYPRFDGTCPDRLVSYFLEFGELYSEGGQIRRQRNRYRSGVGWALDAVEIVEELVPGLRVLSSRPAPWRVAPRWPLATLLLNDGLSLSSTLARRAWDGSSADVAGPALSGGTVQELDLQNAYAGFLSGQVSLDVQDNAALPALDIVATPAQVLTFANGQGGFERLLLEGAREEITKRSSATFATPTGFATRSAELPEAFRLSSSLLTRAEWVWLRRELGNSPATWLETDAGPQALTITAYAAEADETLGTYAISLDCEPQEQPVLGLVN